MRRWTCSCIMLAASSVRRCQGCVGCALWVIRWAPSTMCLYEMTRPSVILYPCCSWLLLLRRRVVGSRSLQFCPTNAYVEIILYLLKITSSRFPFWVHRWRRTCQPWMVLPTNARFVSFHHLPVIGLQGLLSVCAPLWWSSLFALTYAFLALASVSIILRLVFASESRLLLAIVVTDCAWWILRLIMTRLFITRDRLILTPRGHPQRLGAFRWSHAGSDINGAWILIIIIRWLLTWGYHRLGFSASYRLALFSFSSWFIDVKQIYILFSCFDNFIQAINKLAILVALIIDLILFLLHNVVIMMGFHAWRRLRLMEMTQTRLHNLHLSYLWILENMHWFLVIKIFKMALVLILHMLRCDKAECLIHSP